MKNLIIMSLYFLSLAFAQTGNEDKVWRTWYMKPVQGKGKQLSKGLIDHVKKYHGEGQWPEYYYEVLSGPNSGSFAGWSGPHSWKAFDDRERSKADFDHWNGYIIPYLDNSSGDGVSFLVEQRELRYGPTYDGSKEYYHLSWNDISPGAGGDYREIAKTSKKVKEKSKSENYHTIYQVVSGSNPDRWLWEYPIDSMKDLNRSTGLSGNLQLEFEKVLGKEGQKRFNNLYRTTVKNRYREIYKYRKDMSSPQPVGNKNN